MPTVLGNTKTIGMSGAMTGLADNYSGALDNPAGPAMLLESQDFTISYGKLRNSLLNSAYSYQNYTDIGAALATSKGLGLTLSDSFTYKATNSANETLSSHRYTLSLSHRLLEDHLSVGMQTAIESLSIDDQGNHSLLWGFGALYRFPHQIYLGASYHFANQTSPDLNDRVFTQPHRLSLGVSWISNRFFRASFKILSIGSEDRTFLFHLPQEQVGATPSLQYHLGLSYQFISLKGLDGFIYAGTYREDTRSSLGSRQHYTWGVELLPLFFHISAASDVAPQYRNTIFNVSINLAFIFKNSPLYPPQVKGPSGGFLPNPLKISEDWMMSHVQDHPEDSFQPIEPEAQDFASPIKKNKASDTNQNFFQKLFQIFKDE